MLILVVGPPGAGKDTLLEAARQQLAGDLRFRFVRRVLDQPRDRRAETHEPLDPVAFQARQAAGGFALVWRGPGGQYAIPADIAIDIAQGRAVVANVARTLVAEAASRFPVRVIEITAPPETIARRLTAMGRSDAVDTARRHARPIRMPPGIAHDVVLNDGSVAQGARALVAALIRSAEAAPPDCTARPALPL